ncbi:MAG: DNA topoisomerase IV subunit A, partial [Bacilli bacterium]|nr:DNA topoisomerase IV subunit A [Bacilli bacterium]
MKKKNDILKKISTHIEESIIRENLEDIVGERFGRYSRYIIQDRAIPDVRDGLKPVQRRILFAMYKLGIFSNKPFKKSARIVGEVIGKYHPHGDTSVYEAMVRMSQDFKYRLPLIEMHGNNGSIDGDPAAAMRYTEVRLSKYAEYLLNDINKKTVGFIPNFDDEEYEPTVLPSKYPNLLVNGTTGISAGYATDIPPHNVTEIINAVIFRINNPKSNLEEIMHIVQGPDFPTGGIVQGLDGIKNAYKTGRGKIILKAKTEIVEEKNLNKIIISEIPYDVNKSVLVKKMSEVYVAKNVDGIIDIRDESDRTGLRIVVDIKKDANSEFIRNFFFKTTDLQINYNFNMVAINQKKPMTMGILDLLDAYIEHEKQIITNRSNYELKFSQKRLHIVDGLIAMVSILDSVIQTIRNSANKKDAKDNLVAKYDFSEDQAEAIVMLQLYRLTNTDIYSLKDEKEKLEEYINKLKQILSNEASLLLVIKKELLKTLENLKQDRKSVIEHDIEEVKVEVNELIAKEDVVILLTNDGYIKRLSVKAYNINEPTKLKEEDIIIAKYDATTLDTLLLFTNKGNYVYLPIQKIPEVKHKDLGYNVSTLVKIDLDEKVIFSTPISDFNSDLYVIFATKNGLIKRTPISDLVADRYSRALKATKIRKGDVLVSVDLCPAKEAEVVVITKEGYINRYDAEEISIMAPPSFGVKSIELKNRVHDEVVAGRYVDKKDIVTLLTSKGAIKRLKVEEIVKGRKNNVGKLYIETSKNGKNYIQDACVIRKKNISEELDCYISCAKGFLPIEFSILKSSTPANGKKTSLKATLG